MKPTELQKLGITMGLSFNPKDNFKDMLDKGITVFNGFNSQRVLIDSNWEDKKIFKELGQALIEYGNKQKASEISNALQY